MPKGPENLSHQELEKQFRALAQRWRRETEHFSSAARMARHPAYQEIIGLGWAAVPLLLEELRHRPDFWFAALRAITQEDPVAPASAGNIKEMTRAWVEWGKGKGIIR
jgi:hypothetical protein